MSTWGESMPFEIKQNESNKIYRCETCGKLITSNPITYKTCCMNKPVYFCSKPCFTKWLSVWMRRQENRYLQEVKKIAKYGNLSH
jgi:methionyl-tRNA synthetase